MEAADIRMLRDSPNKMDPFKSFLEWYEKRFGHHFNGVSDEDCDLEVCWIAAYKEGQKKSRMV